MFSSGSNSGFFGSGMDQGKSSTAKMMEEERIKKQKEKERIENERERRGGMPQGDRMAGDAINAANEAGIDLEFDRLNKRRENNTARIQELQAQDSRSDFENKELGARGFVDRRISQQEAARKGMEGAGYSGGLENYDAASAGGNRFDLGDVNLLKRQGVSESEIRAYIAGLSDKERGGSLKFGKGTGLYMGDMEEGSKASDYDFGNQVTARDISYLNKQGFSSDQISQAVKDSGVKTGYFADRRLNNLINNTTNNINSNNRTSLNDVGNTKNSNNTNLRDVGNIKDSGNISDSGNTRDSGNTNDSFNTANTATATGIGSGRQDVNNDISQTSNINTVGNNNYVYNPMLNFGSQNTTMTGSASANSGNGGSGSGFSGSAADDILGPYGKEDFGNSFNDYLDNAQGLAVMSTVSNTLQSQPGFAGNRAAVAVDNARATLPVDLIKLNNTIGRRTNYLGDRAEIMRANTFGLPFTPLPFTAPPSYQRQSPPDLPSP